MKTVSANQSKSISLITILGALALIISFSAIAGNVKKADSAAMEITYQMSLSAEEELALAKEVLSPSSEEFMQLPQEVYIYDQDHKLIQHAVGSTEELQQNNQLQAMISNSDLLMEDAGNRYYLRRK